MSCRHGFFLPGRQSNCSTRTLPNWTDSPRPYYSTEEPLWPDPLFFFSSWAFGVHVLKHYIYPSSSLPGLVTLVTKEGCTDAKKWCSDCCLFSYFNQLTQFSKTFSGCSFGHDHWDMRAMWLIISDVDFWVLAVASQQQSPSCQSSLYNFVLCSLGISNTGRKSVEYGIIVVSLLTFLVCQW